MKTVYAYQTRHTGGGVADYYKNLDSLLPWVAEECKKTGIVTAWEFELGDRVFCKLWRGSVEDDDGLANGGKFVAKNGVVSSVTDYGMFVDFDDGDMQSCAKYLGCVGYPCNSTILETK